MKNFVIATGSVFALLGVAATAEKASPKMEKAQPAHMMEKHAECAHHAHHAHKHHLRHHGRHHNHPLAVYVHFPPTNAAALSACPCEYYQDNQAYGYVWHEGYFWYPHARADMLVGYTPHQMRGSYWYPSFAHPHDIYVNGQALTHPELYPVPMEAAGQPMMHHHHHKGKMHHHAGKKMHKAMKPAGGHMAAPGHMDMSKSADRMPKEEKEAAAPHPMQPTQQ